MGGGRGGVGGEGLEENEYMRVMYTIDKTYFQ